MKKIILSAVLAITMFAANAQSKVTKANIVGKWELVAMNVDGMFYFDTEKDSISLGKAIMEQLVAAGQDSAGAVDMMKGQLGAVKEMAFTFNADGTYALDGNPNGADKGTYTVDEATSTLITTNSKGTKKEIKVSFNKERLVFPIPGEGPNPATTLELKKAK
jgi:hypothetical protein